MPNSKNKKAHGLIIIIKNLAQMYLNRLVNIAQLASLEAQLARKTITTMTFLVLIVGFLLISTWMSLLVLIFIFLISLHYTLLFASFVIVMLNLIALLSVYLYILKVKKNLFFPATRRQLSSIGTASKDS